jgi:hypothetical protein
MSSFMMSCGGVDGEQRSEEKEDGRWRETHDFFGDQFVFRVTEE